MKVGLKASGAIGADERAAIEKLGEGLDRALEGLGRDDAVDLDLSGLQGYDRGAIASIDLTANARESHGLLGSFSLHLGDDKQSVALEGSDGQMQLSVDTDAALGDSAAQNRRDAAIQHTQERMERAGERGQANAALIRQMTAAFAQLQSAAAGEGGDAKGNAKGNAGTAAAAPVDPEVSSRLSGLADFDASFGGHSQHLNRQGATNEAGRLDYQLSQKTAATPNAAPNGLSVAQTVSERLSADYRKAPPDAVLDVTNGNYLETQVRDSSTVTTLIESAAHHVERALRKTDEQRLETVSNFEHHRMTQQHATPSRLSLVEQLL